MDELENRHLADCVAQYVLRQFLRTERYHHLRKSRDWDKQSLIERLTFLEVPLESLNPALMDRDTLAWMAACAELPVAEYEQTLKQQYGVDPKMLPKTSDVTQKAYAMLHKKLMHGKGNKRRKEMNWTEHVKMAGRSGYVLEATQEVTRKGRVFRVNFPDKNHGGIIVPAKEPDENDDYLLAHVLQFGRHESPIMPDIPDNATEAFEEDVRALIPGIDHVDGYIHKGYMDIGVLDKGAGFLPDEEIRKRIAVIVARHWRQEA